MLTKTVLISLMLLLAGVTDAAPAQAPNGQLTRRCVKKAPAGNPSPAPVPTPVNAQPVQPQQSAPAQAAPKPPANNNAPPANNAPKPTNNAPPSPDAAKKEEPKKMDPPKDGGHIKDEFRGMALAGNQNPPNGGKQAPAPGGAAGTNFKRGFSFPAQEQDAAPLKQFFENGSKLSWHYNWSKDYKWMKNSEGIGGQFLPMVWGPNSLYEGTNEGADPKTLFPKDAKLIMGFNEPDNHDPKTGSGMEVGRAVELWKKMFDAGRAGNPNVEFASPGMMNDKNWLRQFFEGICPGGIKGCNYAPQYLAVHDYVPDAQTFIKNIEGWRKDFPDLPMIVTEFACANFGQGEQPDDAKVNAYMDEVIPWLDKTEYIYRYAWFTATRDPKKMYGVSKPNSLLNEQGQITDLGKKYMSM